MFNMGYLSVTVFFITFALVSCKEFMPVLMWGNHPISHIFGEVSAFTRLHSDEFSNSLMKGVRFDKPTILVFIENNLSAEDFSWRGVDGKGSFPLLQNISQSANDIAYLSGVENPMRGLQVLKSLGYTWKQYNQNFDSSDLNENIIFEIELKEPDIFQERQYMLREHDKQIAKVYNEAIKHYENVLAVYSGNHNSWIDNEVRRSKREINDANSTTDLIINDEKNIVRMMVTLPIKYETKEPGKDPTIVNIVKVVGSPTIDEKEKLILKVRFMFKEEPISVKFEFTSSEEEWWTLNSIEIPEFKLKNMVPSVDVGAPAHYSFFCNPFVQFRNGTSSMTFENFQVQPRVGKGNDFGPVLHCIPYFSVGIWSGLIVVVILSVVLGWGIVMIMSINTNDRFDDPKGKTITITATD